MPYPPYIREKARTLRVEKHLSIDEIAHRLALPKTTIYYWVRDLPLGRPRRENGHPGNRAMARKARLLREAAYEAGRAEFDELANAHSFRDFVCMYIAEGYKRNRNRVSVANSDPAVITLCTYWIRRFARNPVTFSLQHHADQDLEQITAFWGGHVGVPGAQIRLQRSRTAVVSAGATGDRPMGC
jgi:hypothetical protein